MKDIHTEYAPGRVVDIAFAIMLQINEADLNQFRLMALGKGAKVVADFCFQIDGEEFVINVGKLREFLAANSDEIFRASPA